METGDAGQARVTHADYQALAAFRHALRRFLAFSQSAARAAGVPPRQHQALLAIKGRGEGPAMTVGGLAEDLLIAPHSATELVERLVRAGLLIRSEASADRRRMELFLTDRAEAILHALSEAHLAELSETGPELIDRLQAIRTGRG